MARDPVWTDPTANPYLFDAAGSTFAGVLGGSGGLDSSTAYPDPTRPGTFDSDFVFPATPPAAPARVTAAAPAVTSAAAPAAVHAPADPAAAAGPAPITTAATTPTPARARTAPEPEPAWSRTGTYAAGQVATVGKVDTANIPEPGARRGSLPPGRRSEPTAAYQPVAVYRSKPGTLAAPTLEQTRAQQAADRANEIRGPRPASGRPSRRGPGVRPLSEDRAAQRAARTAGRVGRRSGLSGRRSGRSGLTERMLGTIIVVAFLVFLIVGILAK